MDDAEKLRVKELKPEELKLEVKKRLEDKTKASRRQSWIFVLVIIAIAAAVVIFSRQLQFFKGQAGTARLDTRYTVSIAVRAANKAANGDYAGAVADYDAALKYDQGNPTLLLGKGKALLAMHDYNRAASALQQAHDVSPKAADINYNLALAWWNMTPPDRSDAAYQLKCAFEHDPSLRTSAENDRDYSSIMSSPQFAAAEKSGSCDPKPVKR